MSGILVELVTQTTTVEVIEQPQPIVALTFPGPQGPPGPPGPPGEGSAVIFDGGPPDRSAGFFALDCGGVT